MSKLIIVIGLPGSGKTEYLKKLKAEKKVSAFYDDFQHKAYKKDHDPRLSRHFGPLIAKLKAGQNIAISDILGTQEPYLDLLLNSVVAILPAQKIELHYFNNDPEACRINVVRRARPKETLEKELKFIEKNSPTYVIPKIKRLKVYKED